MKSDCEPVTFKEFEKMDIRVGTIKGVQAHPQADKLYLLLINFGKEDLDRQIIAGIKEFYKPEQLIGKKVVVLVNLEPKMLRGIESQGMILAAENEKGHVKLLTTDKKIEDGAKVH